MEFVEKVDMKPADERYLNFLRVDKFDLEKSFDEIEMDGMLFYANADVLSGLCSWAYFDNNSEDAVLAPFGSGCSSIISMAIRENRLNRDRVFLDGFDP